MSLPSQYTRLTHPGSNALDMFPSLISAATTSGSANDNSSLHTEELVPLLRFDVSFEQEYGWVVTTAAVRPARGQSSGMVQC